MICCGFSHAISLQFAINIRPQAGKFDRTTLP